jgi:hypothetical protein
MREANRGRTDDEAGGVDGGPANDALSRGPAGETA